MNNFWPKASLMTHPQSFSMGRTKFSYLMAYGLGQAFKGQTI